MHTLETKQIQIISKYIYFLHKDKKIAKNKIAEHLNIAPPVLSNLINEKKAGSRDSFTDLSKEKFTRVEFIERIEIYFALGLNENDEVIEKHQTIPHASIFEQADYFVYHHVEYMSNALPVFAKWLLIIKSERQNRSAELQSIKGKKVITYFGEVLVEPQQLILRLIKKDKASKIEDSIVFIKTEDGELNYNILYGTYQASGPRFGLAILERLREPINIEALAYRDTPPEIVLDLLNQQFSPDGNFEPISDLKHHPQHNLVKNLQDFFGVYEGITLVPNFDQLNHFTFEIQKDFKVRYSSRTKHSLDGIARPYKDSLFYLHLDYSKELGFYSKEIIIKLAKIPNLGCIAGIMAGINDNNVPLCGIAMIKKSHQTFEELSAHAHPQDLNNILTSFPDLIDFFAGSRRFSNYVASDSAKTVIRFLDQNEVDVNELFGSLIANGSFLPTSISQEIADLWAGVYNIYRLSTNGQQIIGNLAKLNADGTAELKGYRNHNYFSGRWFLVSEHLVILLDTKNRSTPYLFVLAYRVGNSSRDEHKWFHGLSLSQTTRSEIRSGLEVLHISNEDFEKGSARSIPVPIHGIHSEDYRQLNHTHRGLATFLTGRKQNILHQTRQPEDPFEQDDDLKTTYFNSACLFAIKGHAAQENSKERARYYESFKMELINAIEHGFGLEEEELSSFLAERHEGYFKQVPLKYWEVIEHKLLGN